MAERRVQHLAVFDDLTDLLNRKAVQKLLEYLYPSRDRAVAFLVDLDGFKQDATRTDTDLPTLGPDVCGRLSEPFQIKDFELQIPASVGMARFPADTEQRCDLSFYFDLAL